MQLSGYAGGDVGGKVGPVIAGIGYTSDFDCRIWWSCQLGWSGAEMAEM